MIHISQFTTEQKVFEYWRRPTEAEIKFGHGAVHYRYFNFDKCFDKDGFLAYKVRASDDGLVYHFNGQELSITSKSKLKKIDP